MVSKESEKGKKDFKIVADQAANVYKSYQNAYKIIDKYLHLIDSLDVSEENLGEWAL